MLWERTLTKKQTGVRKASWGHCCRKICYTVVKNTFPCSPLKNDSDRSLLSGCEMRDLIFCGKDLLLLPRELERFEQPSAFLCDSENDSAKCKGPTTENWESIQELVFPVFLQVCALLCCKRVVICHCVLKYP